MADGQSAADWPLRLGGGLGSVVGQLHALSRFATADGHSLLGE